MQFNKIDLFGATDTTTGRGKLTARGEVLPLELVEAPSAQFQFGKNYLLFLPDDPYEGGLFQILVLNSQFKTLESHFAPDLYDHAKIALSDRVRQISSEELELDLGEKSHFVLRAFDRPRFAPREAWVRMTHGWLPLFEYPFLVKRSVLSIRPRRS